MVDYHNHTELCGHASGAIEEYIESAIRKGFRDIGFSDHAPIPESLRAGLSMSPEDVEGYIASIEACKKKYEGEINVRLGFEVDHPLFPCFDARYFTDGRIDYFTGSCHFIDGWPFDHPAFQDGYRGRDIDDLYGRYYAQVLSLVESGLFNVVGHFDIIKKFGYRPKVDFRPVVEWIAKTAASKNVTVEINTNGFFHPVREMYPSDEIIGILFNCNVPVTLGSDSHASDQIGRKFDVAVKKITKAGYRKISGFLRRKRYDVLL